MNTEIASGPDVVIREELQPCRENNSGSYKQSKMSRKGFELTVVNILTQMTTNGKFDGNTVLIIAAF